MISVVVYGRNDHHGYNLHKRAAISLNCLAEVLRDPDDELIFIDYNSPDDTPTFPEAIADTLTQHARALLRILRVRPRIHRSFAGRTDLAIVEAVARNVGIRRSNAANRWILSTNTDIILLPRQAASLSEIAGDLPGGFYHTARFEVPESLWESFDRADPQATMADVRSLGRTVRLNEVVYGSDTILYDGPGDFQLIERADLFEIDGFDERMLQAWHIDSNIAKRLSLKHGPVSSLLDQVYCYHCDHTRQVTPAHSPTSPKNDSIRFVDEVASADLPEQRTSWGCAEDDVEEIRLASNSMSLYRSLMGELVEPLPNEVGESFYIGSTYGQYHYDAQHVLPFIADLLNCYPRDTRLAWCGLRRDIFELVLPAWQRLGFHAPIAVHSAVASYLITETCDGAEIVDQAQWLADADLLAFEFGRVSDGHPSVNLQEDEPVCSDDAEALALVQCVFLAATADERFRLGAGAAAALRRFIGINCIHNGSEELFSSHIRAALTPFSTHLRHGFLASVRHELDSETAARVMIGRHLGRAGPIGSREFDFARDLLAPLFEGAPIPPDQQHRIGANAALGLAYLTAVGDTRKPEMLQRALAAVEELRPSRTLGSALGLRLDERPWITVAERPLSRFAAYEDWHDPGWSIFAQRYATGADDAFCRRDAAAWEKIQLLYGLHAAGALTGTSRVLVVAGMPDAAIAAISQRVGAVEVYGLVGEALDDAAAARLLWCNGAAYNPRALNILAGGTQIGQLQHGAYDAVVFPHGSMFADGLEGALAWLRAAEILLRPGGIVAFKAEIATGSPRDFNYFDVGMLAEDGLASQLAAHSRFLVERGFDPRLSRQTADRISPESGPLAGERYFLSRQDGRILIPSEWFLRKGDRTSPSRWDTIREWMLGRLLGEQISALRVGTAGCREQDGCISTVPGNSGHVFYGPYVSVHPGRYRATFRFEKTGAGSTNVPGWTAEAVVDGETIADSPIDRRSLQARRFTFDFEIPGLPDRAGMPRLEIRVFSPGRPAVRFRSVGLQLLEISDIDAWPHLPPSASFVRDGDGSSSDKATSSRISAEPPASSSPKVGRIVSRGTLQPETDKVRDSPATTHGDASAGDENGPVGGSLGEEFPIVSGLHPGDRPLSRVVAVEDWSDRAWALYQDDMPPAERRDSGLWERAQLCYGLDRSQRLTPHARILVAATMPDQTIGWLTELVGQVEVLDLLRVSGRRGPEARLYWSDEAAYARDRLVVHERSIGFADLDTGVYDAVVFPHGSLFCGGLAGVARVMEMAERVLTPGGPLVFKADILVGTKPDLHHLDAGLIGDGGLTAQIAAMTGFVVDGGFDPRVSRATVQSGQAAGDAAPAPLLVSFDGRLAVPSLWFLTKRRQTSQGGWTRLGRWFTERLLGDQLCRLHLGPAGHREGAGRITTNGVGKGRVFYGPYLALPSGKYEASIAVEVPASSRRGKVRLDVVVAGKQLVERQVRLDGGGASTVRLPFDISPASAHDFEEVEIRAWSQGGEAAFTECRLSGSTD